MGCSLSITTRSCSKKPQETEWWRRSRTTLNDHKILPLTTEAERTVRETREARGKMGKMREVRTNESIPLELMRAEKSGGVCQKYVNAKALAKLEGRA